VIIFDLFEARNLIDVLLIAPPYKGMTREPVGLYYLATALLKNKVSARILDLNLNRMRLGDFQDYLMKNGPRIVGVTSYTFNYYLCENVLRTVKNLRPEIVTILGGIHASSMPEEVLSTNSCVDYIVIGEAENTFLELCQNVLDGRSCEDIQGLAHRVDGVKVNPPRTPIADLNVLGIPDRRALDYQRYPVALVQTSRGCPYSCIFCNICNQYERTIRFRDPKIVVDECEELIKRWNYQQIYFFGDSFTFDKQWVEEFCDEILGRCLKFRWSCETRVDNVDLKILSKMKNSGCHMVQYGIDYGDEKVLKKLGKDFTLSTVDDACEWAKKSKLGIEAFFIFNCPGEDSDTMNNTYKLIQKLPLDALEINLLTPYPGTQIWRNPETHSMKIINKDYWNYTTKKYVLENESFPREKFVPAFKDLLKRMNLVTADRSPPEIYSFLEAEKKVPAWLGD
jgi:anaerobic magnesium-protoporphyrin IX monomethyl ester cyclase